MKIAHVVDSMEVGGAETVVSQMCRLQREQGHTPRVYAVAALGAIGEQMRQEGFEVQAHVGKHFPDAARSFYRIFKESTPDVVHLHNLVPAYYAGMAARIAGVPSIVSTRHSLVGRPHRILAELKYATGAAFCDWVVGICEATRENLKGLHTVRGGKVVRVYNGAAPLRRADEAERPEKAGFTLVFVGRLAPVKNHTLLLHAFQLALASNSGLRLWMVGDGSERKTLEELAARLGITEQVAFWGQQLDVAPFFSAADAFIMSSSSEGLPISLLQAFSLGLPSIVTDVGGMAEAVRFAGAGLTVPLNDPAGMAEAIVRLAGNGAERERFGANAAQAFGAHFTLEAMVGAYFDLYRTAPRTPKP